MKNKSILISSKDDAFRSRLTSFFSDTAMEPAQIADARQLPSTIDAVNPCIILLDADDTEPCIIDQLNLLVRVKSKSPVLLLSSHEEKLLRSLTHIGLQRGLSVFTHEKRLINKETLLEKIRQMSINHQPISEEAITQALENKEFLVYYQPKIAIKTHKLECVEALIRWKKPNIEMIYPDLFIPMAQKSGLIIPLTFWVIKEVFKQYEIWKKAHIHIKYAINITPSLLTDTLFPDEACKLAKEYGVDTSDICFEITESAAMQQTDAVLEILTRFRLLGFALSIDDFGTGYSSLVELQRLPFNELKIDKSFVYDLPSNETNQLITRSIIELGHNMNLSIVAEGVESIETWTMLEALECDIAQGYLMAKPLSVREFEEWHKQYIDQDGLYMKKDCK